MTILLTNDDGVKLIRDHGSKKAAENLGETLVVAPATQQSGIGHALTLFEPVRVTGTNMPDGTEAHMVSGTPTDAVIIGIFQIAQKKPDWLFLWINIGEKPG
jgi:5'-nucleotidase